MQIKSLNYGLLLILMALSITSHAQFNVGDPNAVIETNKFDPDYPQMERWAKAGTRDGIPILSTLQKGITVTAKNSAGINNAINNCQAGKYVYLPNGKYTIDSKVRMKSNVFLVGESRDSVICEISMTKDVAFAFESDDKNCGIYKLTIQGSWGKPHYDWNFGLGTEVHEELKNNTNVSVKFKDANDCFLDKVNILNSAHHPVWINAKHITLRDLHIDGVFNKGGGCQGYLMVANSDNLITGCFVTHLRHISLQGDNVEYNVLFNNRFEQEISYHSGDNGNNLIENNTISLPKDMWKSYYAIMGPWSIQHHLSHKPNFAYRNKCFHYNQSTTPLSPWSNDTVVYYGPHKVKPTTHQGKIDNFTAYDKGAPLGGTLYAVLLGDPVSVTNIKLSTDELNLKVNESQTLTAVITPDSASNKTMVWKSENPSIASIKNGVVTGVTQGETSIIVTATDGQKTDTCQIIVKGIMPVAVENITLSESVWSMGLETNLQLTETIYPENATDKTVKWSSSNPDIASVDNGLITALKQGSTTITASTTDGNYTASCSITVTQLQCYTETFSNMRKTGWGAPETYKGDYGFRWTVNGKGTSGNVDNSRDTYFNNQPDNGVKSSSIPGGISFFSVKCKAIDVNGNGNDERILELKINDEVYTHSHVGTEVYSFTVTDLKIEGDIQIAISNRSPGDGPAHIAIDNITWTVYNPTSASLKTDMNETQVFPNPFTNQLFIKTNNTTNNFELRTLSGHTIVSTTLASNQMVEIPARIAKGIYLVYLTNNEHTQVFKMVKH